MNKPSQAKLDLIGKGVVIPASPLALSRDRQFDPERQAALMRYYIDAGAGGVAVGVHFTQFEIRNPDVNLYRPVLETCARALDDWAQYRNKTLVKIAGINGTAKSAHRQVETACELGYDFAIISMARFKNASLPEMVRHMQTMAQMIPLFGFYLLTGVGGIVLPYRFWREVVEIDNMVGIKIAPFNRYFTLDVCRAVVDAGKEDEIVLYTGNDDSIVYDLITPYRFQVNGEQRTVRMRGGLLGQWACWTQKAVELLNEVHRIVDNNLPISAGLLARGAAITDANAALFDPIHGYAGSIPGVNEILRRQGLLTTIRTLKSDEVLSPGQLAEIDRVTAMYPDLQDNGFVAENLDTWLRGTKSNEGSSYGNDTDPG